MTDPVTCPHCREQLDIPAEYRGRSVRCASCKTVFATPPLPDAPAASPAREERGDDERPAGPPRPRRYDDAADRRPRAGNGVVWGVLLLTLLTVGGCVGGCLLLFAFMYNPKMHPFTSPEAKFRIEFPGDGVANTTGVGTDTITVTAHRNEGQEKYTVKRFELPARLRGLPAEDALTEVAKKELQGEGVSPDARREVTTHDEFPAVDMRGASGKGMLNRRVMIVRCVLAGQTVYVVSAHGQSMEEQSLWWVRRYFTSFELTDPPKKAKGAKAEKGAEPKKGE